MCVCTCGHVVMYVHVCVCFVWVCLHVVEDSVYLLTFFQLFIVNVNVYFLKKTVSEIIF